MGFELTIIHVLYDHSSVIYIMLSTGNVAFSQSANHLLENEGVALIIIADYWMLDTIKQ